MLRAKSEEVVFFVRPTVGSGKQAAQAGMFCFWWCEKTLKIDL